MRYTIRTKATMLFIALFVGIILPAHWLIYNNAREVLTEASHREMNFEAEKLFAGVRLDPLTVPLSPSYSIRLMYNDGIREETVFVSPDFPTAGELTDGYFEMDTAEVVTIQRSLDDSRGTFNLSISRSNYHLKNRLEELRNDQLLISGCSVVVAVLLVYIASGRMLKPLREIATVAERINASESIERIPLPETTDESRTLAEALNAMLDRMERSIRNQTNFFASATHELKTPLAIMKAGLSVDEIKRDERWSEILLEVERLDRVINDFLLISQLRTSTLVLRKRTYPFDELLYQSLKKISRLKERKQAAIQLTVDENVVGFHAEMDADKMETVLTNLLENAVKYSFSGEVRIFLSKTGNAVRLECINPIQFHIENASQLATEFTKSKELSDGLGMGLWICSEILKLHGGGLTLTAEGMVFKSILIIPAASIPQTTPAP